MCYQMVLTLIIIFFNFSVASHLLLIDTSSNRGYTRE